MDLLCFLLLLTDGPATGPDNRSLPVAELNGVVILKADPLTQKNPFRHVVDSNAIRQVTAAAPPVDARSTVPVTSIERGLPLVQKASRNSVRAAIEIDGWFFYGTTVVGPANKPEWFIQGYAIRRDGKDVIPFSVW